MPCRTSSHKLIYSGGRLFSLPLYTNYLLSFLGGGVSELEVATAVQAGSDLASSLNYPMEQRVC
jgi:hypothetical protein